MVDHALHTLRTTLSKEPALIDLALSTDGLVLQLHWFDDDDMPKWSELTFSGVSSLTPRVNTLKPHQVLALGSYEPRRVSLILDGSDFVTLGFENVRARVAPR